MAGPDGGQGTAADGQRWGGQFQVAERVERLVLERPRTAAVVDTPSGDGADLIGECPGGLATLIDGEDFVGTGAVQVIAHDLAGSIEVGEAIVAVVVSGRLVDHG